MLRWANCICHCCLLRVLVHAATGGVGLAAVQLLQVAGLHGIIATAGSPAKRALLRCVCYETLLLWGLGSGRSGCPYRKERAGIYRQSWVRMVQSFCI